MISGKQFMKPATLAVAGLAAWILLVYGVTVHSRQTNSQIGIFEMVGTILVGLVLIGYYMCCSHMNSTKQDDCACDTKAVQITAVSSGPFIKDRQIVRFAPTNQSDKSGYLL